MCWTSKYKIYVLFMIFIMPSVMSDPNTDCYLLHTEMDTTLHRVYATEVTNPWFNCVTGWDCYQLTPVYLQPFSFLSSQSFLISFSLYITYCPSVDHIRRTSRALEVGVHCLQQFNRFRTRLTTIMVTLEISNIIHSSEMQENVQHNHSTY